MRVQGGSGYDWVTCGRISILVYFLSGVKGAQVEEIYDLSKPIKG